MYVEIKRKAKDAVLQLIEQEREGEQIDRALVKNVLGIFIEVSWCWNVRVSFAYLLSQPQPFTVVSLACLPLLLMLHRCSTSKSICCSSWTCSYAPTHSTSSKAWFASCCAQVGMGGMDAYERDFEEYLLTGTAEYYKRKASVWVEEDSCPDYMIKAEDCLRTEEERVNLYLHHSTRPKLLKEVERELLTNYEMQLLEKEHSGCAALLRDDKVSAILV